MKPPAPPCPNPTQIPPLHKKSPKTFQFKHSLKHDKLFKQKTSTSRVHLSNQVSFLGALAGKSENNENLLYINANSCREDWVFVICETKT